MRPPLIAVFGIVLASLAGGCGLLAFDEAPVAVNECADDGACGPDAACERTLGICVARSRPSFGVFLRYTYPSSTGATIREVRSQPLAEPLAELSLPAVLDLQGWVAADEDGDGVRDRTVAARVTLRRPSSIPGERPEAAEFTASGSPATIDWDDGTAFSAPVPASHPESADYEVFVEPTGEDAKRLPPVLARAFRAETGRRLTVTLHAPATLRRVRGMITRSDGAGVPNLSVRAEDPETGRRISTIAESAPVSTMAGDDDPPAPTGSFEILLPPDVASFRLVVTPTAAGPTFPTMVYQSLSFADLDVEPADGVVAFDGTEQAPLSFPAVGLPVRLEGRVEGVETDTRATVPVRGATLRFVRSIDTGTAGVTATFEQVAVTDASGRIFPPGEDPDGNPYAQEGVALLEGDYAVTITPPLGVRMAGLHRPFLRVAPPTPTGERVQRGQMFQLAPRAPLAGTVLDLLGNPAGALAVEAQLLQPAGGGDGADVGNLNRVVGGSTGADGVFDLFVDPGAHVLVLRPTESAAFPWRFLAGVTVPNGPVDVALEGPVVLAGIVTIAGTATPGVLVEALVRNETLGASAVVVGRATADAAGAYRLLLSPSLGTL